jgi:hypothetical protein
MEDSPAGMLTLDRRTMDNSAMALSNDYNNDIRSSYDMATVNPTPGSTRFDACSVSASADTATGWRPNLLSCGFAAAGACSVMDLSLSRSLALSVTDLSVSGSDFLATNDLCQSDIDARSIDSSVAARVEWIPDIHPMLDALDNFSLTNRTHISTPTCAQSLLLSWGEMWSARPPTRARLSGESTTPLISGPLVLRLEGILGSAG